MMSTLVTGLLLMALLTAVWLGVQRLALRSKGDDLPGEDALSGGTRCQGCTCDTQSCHRGET